MPGLTTFLYVLHTVLSDVKQRRDSTMAALDIHTEPGAFLAKVSFTPTLEDRATTN